MSEAPAVATSPREGGLQSVIKAFALIDALIEKGEAGAAELAEQISEPRSSVYRMLATLQQMELVEPGARRGLYQPGLALIRLAGSVLMGLDERQLTLPVLERLHAETRETVHLTLRRGFHAVFIERLQGDHAFAIAVRLGGVLPLHVGAAPATLLAFEPDQFWDDYFAQAVIEPMTPASPRTEDEIRERLLEIRRTGVAVSDEDVVSGVATVGAPIFDHRGAPRAALAFNLVPEALRADQERYLDLVRTASIEASLAFGYDLAARGLPVPS
jgi:DNA-binding IclR family transcriptional regulator